MFKLPKERVALTIDVWLNGLMFRWIWLIGDWASHVKVEALWLESIRLKLESLGLEHMAWVLCKLK